MSTGNKDGKVSIADLAALGAIFDTEGRLTSVVPGAVAYPYVTNPAGLRRWRAALADALLGRAVVSCVGDSVTLGVGSDGSATYAAASDTTYRTSGWVAQLRSLFGVTYGTHGEGGLTSNDPLRIALASGAVATASVGPLKGGITLNAAGQTATFTLPACTEIDIYTWNGSSPNASACSYNVDGAGAVNFTPGTGAASSDVTFKKTTITGLANSTHTIVLTGTTNATFVAAVVARQSTTGVEVNRYGVSGSTTANLVGLDSSLNGNASGQARMMNATVKCPQADLVVVSLGVNDFGAQNATSATAAQPGTTPTAYAANLQAFASVAIASGACVLFVAEPRQNSASYPSPMTYAESDYYSAAKAIAQNTDHVSFIDIGDVWGTNIAGQALSLYNTSSVHPTRRGHADMARIIYGVLVGAYSERIAAG